MEKFDGGEVKVEESIDPSNTLRWVRGKLIGEGVFASVYMAKMIKPPTIGSRIKDYHPIMAVKTTNTDCASEYNESLNDKKILDLLIDCPYIIQCYGDDITIDTNVDDDGNVNKVIFYNIFLEYASGGTLLEFIDKSPLYNESKQVKCYVQSILKGVECIHDKGIVHCDLKPDNILLVKEKEDDDYFVAKVSDFGSSKMANDCRTPVRGTYEYQAPECRNDKIQEQYSDIWAVGVIVLFMLTKKWNWKDKLSKYISEDAKDFLLKCFEIVPSKRPSAKMLLSHPFVAIV
ncbi:hypothetical protein F8388_015251 [Cannabis sativa]|uniref:Protein kinase domain-containing protein n=2 Tax=Cannabis sativa TaxID=3483 RepID=A0AB40EAD5_CANSA|nr:hypothetical protein F8388_015251 [Cannabis sativa]KAF4395497.1 hypothetical protein G4B88_010961 [Cannabis sativa]